jgi:hypothetical protein
MSCLACHAVPDKEAIERNKTAEPLGEKIRAELIDWLQRNKIVTAMLDTDEHCISVDIIKLPPEIKPALTLWGSIYVRNEAPPSPREPEAREAAPKVSAREFFKHWPEIGTIPIALEKAILRFAEGYAAHLTAELATVRQQLEKSNGHAAECFRKERTRAESAESRAKELEAALLQAREALRKYGYHADECDSWDMRGKEAPPCTCGFAASLSGENQ